MCMQVGKVLESDSFMLQVHIGEFEVGGKKFELATTANYAPIVNHPDGRKFVLSWQDVANMALDAFDENTEIEKVESNENS